jgi:hypothetical protein
MIGTESSDVIADSCEEREEAQNGGATSASANSELIEEYDEERMLDIQKRWYSIDFEHKFNFPECFVTVPAHHSANRIWMSPMDYEEVAYRLLGTKDNVEPNLLPEPIIQFYRKSWNMRSTSSQSFSSNWTIMSTISKYCTMHVRMASLQIF